MKTARRRLYYRRQNGLIGKAEMRRAIYCSPVKTLDRLGLEQQFTSFTGPQYRRDKHKRNHNSVKATRVRFRRSEARAAERTRKAKLREVMSSPNPFTGR
jgi:hypothetical protein